MLLAHVTKPLYINHHHHHHYHHQQQSSLSHMDLPLAHKIWSSSIPLHLTHASSALPYLISVPRQSYLALLLPRLSTFFGPEQEISSFAYEEIQLKNLPVGLLCDLYQPELPWRLTLENGPLFDIHDTFVNSVKEACHSCYRTSIYIQKKEHSCYLIHIRA